MRGAPTEVPVIDQERRGQAQQRLGRQERHLPAAAGRPAQGQRPELLPRLADRQVQVISQVSHVRRLQPARPHKEPLSWPATSAPSIGAPYDRHDCQCLRRQVAVRVTWETSLGRRHERAFPRMAVVHKLSFPVGTLKIESTWGVCDN
jgi:hypothetical protein